MTGAFLSTPEWLTLDWQRATLEREQLCIQRCGSCGRWRHPPRRRCPASFADEATFEPVAGSGVVHTYAVSHRSIDPEWQALAPFATLVIELDEGPRVLAATELAPVSVAVGLAVVIEVVSAGAGVAQLWARAR